MPSPTSPTPNPPRGNCGRIPATEKLDLSTVPEACQLAVSLIASASRIARKWVGVDTWAVTFGLIAEANGRPARQPADDFATAEREGWIRLIGPYAHPTQKLADFVTGADK